MLNALNRIFSDPRVQVALMLWTASLALMWSETDALITLSLIVCAVWWMFRIWGGLRAQAQEKDQS